MDGDGMMRTGRILKFCTVAIFALPLAPSAASAPQLDPAAVIRLVDSNVQRRVEDVLAFTDIEHYSVYRGSDEVHPIATMTARDSYTNGVGKTYTILAQTGSVLVDRFGLRPLIANEEEINKPGSVQRSWFTSANYEMRLMAGGARRVNGRMCYGLTIVPKQKAPNMVDGTLWVDASDGSIVQVDGVASKSPSPFAGTTHLMRQYATIDGFPMAIHARAESKSALFGRTVVRIEYSDYHLQVKGGR